jgi:CheY-like chemotaxis protein
VTPAEAPNSEPAAASVLLVVEDDVMIRALMSDYLRGEGFTVIEAADADEGLQVLRSAGGLALMVTDVRMPGAVDGIELARQARQLRPGLRLIVSSGHAAEPEALRAADLFMRKPYDLAHLTRRIRELIGRAD